jgi:hypothetical protein
VETDSESKNEISAASPDGQAPSKTKKKGWRKAVDITLDVLFGLLLVFSILGIGVAVAQKRSTNDALTVNGTQLRYVQTGSMASNKTIDPKEYRSYPIQSLPINTLVAVKTIGNDHDAFYSKLKVGDVITFYYYEGAQTNNKQIMVTHRIRSIEDDPRGGYVITAKGDAVTEDSKGQVIKTHDDQTSYTYIIGKVVWANYPIGATLHFLTSQWGIVLVIILPCAILFFYEVGKIINLLVKDFKERRAAALSQKDQELEEMRKRLEALEQEKNQSPSASDGGKGN